MSGACDEERWHAIAARRPPYRARHRKGAGAPFLLLFAIGVACLAVPFALWVQMLLGGWLMRATATAAVILLTVVIVLAILSSSPNGWPR